MQQARRFQRYWGVPCMNLNAPSQISVLTNPHIVNSYLNSECAEHEQACGWNV